MNSATSPAVAARGASANVKGIGWMLVTGFFFVGVTGIVRHLGTDMAPVQAAFLRYVIGLVMLSPLLFRAARTPILSKRMGMHAVRGLVHGIGVMRWFYAMARIPIAEVTALGFYAFAEKPDAWTIIGGALIVGSATYIAHREVRRTGRATPKAVQGLLDSANGGPKPRA